MLLGKTNIGFFVERDRPQPSCTTLAFPPLQVLQPASHLEGTLTLRSPQQGHRNFELPWPQGSSCPVSLRLSEALFLVPCFALVTKI